MAEKKKREKHEAPEKPTWKARIRKTYQDRQPAGSRQRVLDHSDRLDFMAKKKPRNSKDWHKYRGN